MKYHIPNIQSHFAAVSIGQSEIKQSFLTSARRPQSDGESQGGITNDTGIHAGDTVRANMDFNR
jgi:hypothetical protein